MINPITSTLTIVVIAMILAGSLYIVKQWEKAAVLRLGKIIGTVEPGLHFRVPIIDTVTKVDMRTQTVDLKGQSAITKDNISVGVDAVVFMTIESPEKIITQIVNYRDAVSKYAQTAIRNIIGQYDLDDLLESREEIAVKLKEEIDKLAKDWGIDVTRAGLQDISLPEDMKRAFAVQAEAERESRAILIKADAELQASSKLAAAAKNMQDPNAMQLRILSTVNDVSKDQSNTIILALPLETLRAAGIQGVASLSAIGSKINTN
ncbi:slipin family protein [Candidatus Bathyarchaeota archaeon]|nr:slipin family protein [Candidatus Bathyarchaeota archaeon]MBL7079294.1 slipin family protein [Candidatus Bathyarchaeota archaeon]